MNMKIGFVSQQTRGTDSPAVPSTDKYGSELPFALQVHKSLSSRMTLKLHKSGGW